MKGYCTGCIRCKEYHYCFMSVQQLMLIFLSKDNKFIKSGKQVRLAEAMTLDFIARNTTITIPRVLDLVSVDGIVQNCPRIHRCACARSYIMQTASIRSRAPGKCS